MTLEINIQKKHVYLLASIFIFIIAVSLVIAYRDTPNLSKDYYTTIGHSPNEIDWANEILQLITKELCISRDCKTSWPSGTLAYSAGTGLSLSGQTLSLKTPVVSQIGGVRISSCSSSKKATGIDATGSLICGADDIQTITAPELTGTLSCSGIGQAVCSCATGWGIYSVTSPTAGVFIGYAAAWPAYPPSYPSCTGTGWTSFPGCSVPGSCDIQYLAVVGSCGSSVSASYRCQRL